MEEQLFRLRQQDIAPEQDMRGLAVHLIGTGGIGSWVALLGAKLGLDLVLYDGDIVGPENVGSQLFGPAQVGQPKATACAGLAQHLAGASIRAIDAFVQGGEPLAGIVVFAVDSMRARADLWQRAVRPRAGRIERLIDVRMGQETGMLLAVRPAVAADAIWYETNLYPDEMALQLPCTGRAISYCASIAAGLCVNTIKRCLMRQPVCRRVDFDLANLMFMTEE